LDVLRIIFICEGQPNSVVLVVSCPIEGAQAHLVDPDGLVLSPLVVLHNLKDNVILFEFVSIHGEVNERELSVEQRIWLICLHLGYLFWQVGAPYLNEWVRGPFSDF